MHDTWQSVIIRVSRVSRAGGRSATNIFKVEFESINSSLSAFLLTVSNPLTYSLLNPSAMPRTPQPLEATVVPTLQRILLSTVFSSTNSILSFNPTYRELVTYYWLVLQILAT